MGATCYQLELAMRVFCRQQQAALDAVLQKSSPQRSKEEWTPTPSSYFLKELFKTYPVIAPSL
jgi:hypothetical protein